MEIVTRHRIEARFWPFLGPIIAVPLISTFFLGGVRPPALLTLLAAVSGSVAFVVIRCRAFARASVDESSVTLRPEWQCRFAVKPFSFRWEEVRRVRRWPSFARDLYAGLHILLDRPKRFWTFRRQPASRVSIQPSIARNADFLEFLRRHVPPDRIAPGALDPRGLPHSLRRRAIGALILLACIGWAAWGVGRIIQGGSQQQEICWLAGSLGTATLIFCTELSAVVGLICATWLAALSCSDVLAFFSTLAGTSAALAGCLSANVGAIAAAIALVLIGRPRWRHALLFYAFIAIGFFAGSSLYDGIPVTRVATGHLPLSACWTPSGDGFLISTATLIWGDSPGPVDMQWYDENARPGNRLTLPHDPYVRSVGQEGAFATTRTEDSEELWFLPRRSGPARKLAAPAGNFHISPSKRSIVFRRDGKKGETWERCEVDTGGLMHFDLPATMKGAQVNWGKDDSTLVWIVGSKPIYKDGSDFTWRTPLPENGVFRELGKLYRLWIWKAGAPPQSYEARTQWLDTLYVAREERLYVCRVAEDPPFRKEFVAIDFSGPEIVIAPANEEAFTEQSKPSPAAVRAYEVIGPKISRCRAFIEETATGKRRFLSQGPPLMEWGDFTQWSPRGDRFLMTGLEWRMPADFWCWKRDPVENVLNGAAVYMVKVESPPASVFSRPARTESRSHHQ